jgi:tetratricopeptide (TPR) repeat protein
MNPVLLTSLVILTAACAFAGCSPAPEESASAERLVEADEMFNGRQYAEAGRLFEAIANDAEAAGDASAFVEAASMRARSYLILEDGEAGRRWLDRAAARATESDALGWSRYLGVRGRFEWKDGDNPTATATFRAMFDYCGTHELWSRAIDAAHMVAITGDPEERFEWAEKAIAMAESGELTGWLGPLWNNLGWDYVGVERYDEARDALEKAREYHYMGESDLPKLIADYSVAHVIRLQGRTADAKIAMRDVFDWASRLNDEDVQDAVEWMGFSRWELGEVAVTEGETSVAIQLMSKALSIKP